MNKEKSWERITELGKYLRKGWERVAISNGLKISIFGIPALSSFRLESKFSQEYKTFITQEMLKEGYLASNSCYLSISHTEQIIDAYLYRLDKIFKQIRDCEDKKNIHEYLKYPVSHSGFKRLN